MFILGIVLIIVGAVLMYTAWEMYKGKSKGFPVKVPLGDALGGGIPAAIILGIGLWLVLR